jgi:GTPase SAR1 family protein
MEASKNNAIQTNPTKFKVKLIGKSFVGKTTFINKINNPDFSLPYEKSKNPSYKINFKYKYKTDIFYFEEESEINLDKPTISFESILSKQNYIALLFIFDLSEKESFDYILKSYEKIYSNTPFKNILKILIGNKNDLNEKLRVVNKDDIDKATKLLSAEYFEISSRKTDDIYKIISHVYLKVKDTVRSNEYSYGLTNEGAYFLEKEKLVPNYYEIIIMGDRDSGKNSLKNKFLYDCSEKNVSIYEYCIPKTKSFGNKEIKFDILIASDNNETKEDKPNEFNPEFFYKTIQNFDICNIGILLTYDV